MRRVSRSLFSAIILVVLFLASCTEIQVKVDSRAGPWDPVANSGYAYGIGDQLPPIVIDARRGFVFSPGNTITVTYVSGEVRAGEGYPWTDAGGEWAVNDTLGISGQPFPSKYMPADWDTNLMALVGTFADSNGIIVGNPFEIGNGPTSFVIPSGASRLQLGVNDDVFCDDNGSFTVKIQLEGAEGPCAGSPPASTLGASSVSGPSDLARHLVCFLLPLGVVMGLRTWRRKR